MPPASLPILDEKFLTCSESSGTNFKPCQSKSLPHLITLEDLNDLGQDLNLSKGKSKLLGSRLLLWNLLSPGTKVSFYHQRSKCLSNFFLLMVNFAIVMIFLHCLKVLVQIMNQMTGGFLQTVPGKASRQFFHIMEIFYHQYQSHIQQP